MPYRAQAATVLDNWRAAERMRDAALGAQAVTEWQAEMDRLKTAYVAVIDAAREAHMPEPASWPLDAGDGAGSSPAGSTPPADMTRERERADVGDGGFAVVYERLSASVGEVEADAIFADAKVKLGTASLDDWLTEVNSIARERHPGVVPA